MNTTAKKNSGLRRAAGVGLFVLAWLVCLGYGWHRAMVYDSTPGKAATREITVKGRSDAPYRCVLVAHPLCPCTRASLKALRVVQDTYPGQFACTIVFAGEIPADCENLNLAKALPAAKVDVVSAKVAKARYDAHTSGQAFIFDSEGTLLFSGGLTAQRGLEDPRFALTIFEQVQGNRRRQESYPVYGCALGD